MSFLKNKTTNLIALGIVIKHRFTIQITQLMLVKVIWVTARHSLSSHMVNVKTETSGPSHSGPFHSTEIPTEQVPHLKGTAPGRVTAHVPEEH